MIWIDVGVVGALGVAGYRGYHSGFLRSTVGLMAVACGVFVAARGWSVLQPLVVRIVRDPQLAKWVSVILLAASATVAVDWLLQRVRRILEQGLLGVLNQIAGASFGVLLTAFVIGLLLLAVGRYGGASGREFIHGSWIAPSLVKLTQYVLGIADPILPQNVVSSPLSLGVGATRILVMVSCLYG